MKFTESVASGGGCRRDGVEWLRRADLFDDMASDTELILDWWDQLRSRQVRNPNQLNIS